ncbi:hypothetical protein ACHAQH_001112 [Verticillium albo-atrum]
MAPQLARIAGSTRTPHEKRVWTALCQVPKGQVTTYALLAAHLGSSPRAVGNALRRNPFAPQVPCHRVVATGGKLGGFKGRWPRDGEGITLDEKRMLLRREGVKIDDAGRVLGTPFQSYRIGVPPFADRPPAFTLGPSPDLANPRTPRLPLVLACHCNDCRVASGHSSFEAIQTPAPQMTVSAIQVGDDRKPQSHTGRLVERPTTEYEVAASDADRPPYLPALDVLRPGVPGAEDTTLRFYHSFICDKDAASRSFCTRCGGPVAFHCRPQAEWFGPSFKQPEGWSDFVDVPLGTVDRHHLNKEGWLSVEHDQAWDEALCWNKAVLVKGRAAGSRRHPSGALSDEVPEADLLKP